MNYELIKLTSATPFVYGLDFGGTIDLSINYGENPSIIGSNGAGKTKLAEIICGKVALKSGTIRYGFMPDGGTYVKGRVVKMGFESAYTMADYNNMYYQQRFSACENTFDAVENKPMPTVKDHLDAVDGADKDYWISKLNLAPLFHKTLIMLSSGELRRFLIASVLIRKPDLVIFDNPFIGLDVDTKAQLNQLFSDIADRQQMIFIIPDIKEIPEISKTVIPVKNMKVLPKMSRENFLADKDFQKSLYHDNTDEKIILPIKEHSDLKPFDIAAQLHSVSIEYPSRTLFKNLSWTIHRGEKWALTGGNGSGKSTLLSLITADNPRAYNMDITLFDHKRGIGESIWDIKKRIGYISAEMHLYFRENQPCVKVVASGLFDTQGLFRVCHQEQYDKALEIMRTFGIAHLAERPFLKTSDGEQRLVLLARTLIKNPDLLILDEPLHGLDAVNKKRARNVIDFYCRQSGRTLIYVTHNFDEIPGNITERFSL